MTICMQFLQFFSIAANCLQLIAHVSQNGLYGQFLFSQHTSTDIQITAELATTLQYPDQIWSWGINEFPVDYSIVDSNRCSNEQLGTQLINFDETLGYLTLPGNETSSWLSNNVTLTGKYIIKRKKNKLSSKSCFQAKGDCGARHWF